MYPNTDCDLFMTAPMVSVCIPAYGGGTDLRKAIASVLAQSYQNFELLVVDDASPENLQYIVSQFDDPRLVYHRNGINLGPQGNWNRCLSLARGHYFKLLPHDDLLHPDCLKRQVSVLDQDLTDQVALVFCARNVVGPDGKLLTRRSYPGGKDGRVPGSEVKHACVRRGTNLVGEPGAVLFRKSLADQIGLFDASQPYVIDLDYWFRLLTHGSAYFISDHLSSFRVSNKSWSVTIGQAQDRDFTMFVERVFPTLKNLVTSHDQRLMRVNAWINKWLRQSFYFAFLR